MAHFAGTCAACGAPTVRFGRDAAVAYPAVANLPAAPPRVRPDLTVRVTLTTAEVVTLRPHNLDCSAVPAA